MIFRRQRRTRRESPTLALVGLVTLVVAVISFFYGMEKRSLLAMEIAGVTGVITIVSSIFLPNIGRFGGFMSLLLALLFAVGTVDYAPDLPAYLRGESLVMEGNASDFQRTRGGGMTVSMREGVEFTIPADELPPDPDIRFYRVHYLPKTKFVVDCYWWGPNNGWQSLCKQ